MSVYPAPSSYPSIFNPAVFSSYSNDSYLSTADANSTYAKLAGGQTIVAEETFAGGVKTSTINTPSNALSVSGNVTVNNTASQAFLAVKSGTNSTLLQTDTSGNGYLDTAQQLYIRPAGTTKFIMTTGGLMGVNMSSVSTLINKNAALYCNGALYTSNLECAGNVIQGSVTTFASSFNTAATTHTITSTQLSWLANNGWNGELKLFADDGTAATNGAISVVYLHKPGSTLTVVQGNRSSSTTITTTAASNTSLTVALSNSCRICWIFTGAT